MRKTKELMDPEALFRRVLDRHAISTCQAR
jgi:hypothetical protein